MAGRLAGSAVEGAGRLPYLTLGIAVPLLAATALSLLPGRLPKLAACAVHAWILLALLSALAGVAALITIILIVPALALLLTAAVFGANSAAFIVLALRDLTKAPAP
jgi:hypothetical protein